MQNYRIPLSEISPSGKDMTLDDPAIWQGPLAEFQMDCRIIDPLKAELGIMPLEGGYLVRGSITGEDLLESRVVVENGVSYLDLGAICWEEFVLALPVNPLCRPDCKGLCPQCGANLNDGPCQCAPEEGDPRMAVLRGLKLRKN